MIFSLNELNPFAAELVTHLLSEGYISPQEVDVLGEAIAAYLQQRVIIHFDVADLQRIANHHDTVIDRTEAIGLLHTLNSRTVLRDTILQAAAEGVWDAMPPSGRPMTEAEWLLAAQVYFEQETGTVGMADTLSEVVSPYYDSTYTHREVVQALIEGEPLYTEGDSFETYYDEQPRKQSGLTGMADLWADAQPAATSNDLFAALTAGTSASKSSLEGELKTFLASLQKPDKQLSLL